MKKIINQSKLFNWLGTDTKTFNIAIEPYAVASDGDTCFNAIFTYEDFYFFVLSYGQHKIKYAKEFWDTITEL